MVARDPDTRTGGWRSRLRAACRRRAGLAPLLVALFVSALAGVSGHVTLAGAQPAAAGPLYDLQGDERLGGHTLARHVGKSDEELAERLRREPQISAASTYPDETLARRVVGTAIAQGRGRIRGWAQRSGPRPNLVLNYQSGGVPIGRALARGARVSRAATRAIVVLRWSERHQRWYVLTSYPEARR